MFETTIVSGIYSYINYPSLFINMFSFERVKTGQDPLFYIGERPVFVHYKKDQSKRIPPFVDSKVYLDSDAFRERYDLSRAESKDLKQAITSDIVPEGKLKSKFYHIRKDLNNRLYSEIDLRNTDMIISWKYPMKKDQWPGTQIIIGSSGVGKTYYVVQAIIEALKRKRKRNFIYISPELELDETLAKLKHTKRWAKYFKGIDISDASIKLAEVPPEQFWKEHVETHLLDADPGTTIILDDAPDSAIHKYLQAFLIKYLRTGRHKKVGIVSIQHNVRGGKWTSQSFSSVKYITLFPRGGGKGKQVDFLNETVGLTRRQAREMVEIFGDSGRHMTIHAWSPSVLFGPKYAVFV